jgi:hypothetical protein
MRYFSTLGLLLLLGLTTLGCCPPPNTSLSANEAEAYAPGEQRFRLEYVLGRTGGLRPGMAKFQVAILLGAPAVMTDSTWFYLNDAGIGCALKLNFRGNTYVSKEQAWR